MAAIKFLSHQGRRAIKFLSQFYRTPPLCCQPILLNWNQEGEAPLGRKHTMINLGGLSGIVVVAVFLAVAQGGRRGGGVGSSPSASTSPRPSPSGGSRFANLGNFGGVTWGGGGGRRSGR